MSAAGTSPRRRAADNTRSRWIAVSAGALRGLRATPPGVRACTRALPFLGAEEVQGQQRLVGVAIERGHPQDCFDGAPVEFDALPEGESLVRSFLQECMTEAHLAIGQRQVVLEPFPHIGFHHVADKLVEQFET